LCQLFELVGDTKRALELATTHLAPIAGGLVGDWRAAVHLDTTSAFIAANRLREADEHLRWARAAASPGSFAQAAATMHQSEIHLALRDNGSAIASASEAIAELRRLRRPRHVGAALAVRAEALSRAGRPREAGADMSEALDLMRRYAHPLRLANEYRRSARITNDRRHARIARELWHAHAVRL
jgi:hypothetical protein